MRTDPHRPPDLETVTGAFLAAGAKFVVIGGFAVVANGHVRGTRDVDLLVPDTRANDAVVLSALESLDAVRERDGAPVTASMLGDSPHLRLKTTGGVIDLVREGEGPLDYETVASRALDADFGGGPFLVAGLASLVGFKRLANRPQDRADLEELEAIHGELPVEPIPGVDDD